MWAQHESLWELSLLAMAVGQSKQLVWIDLIASRLTPTRDLWWAEICVGAELARESGGSGNYLGLTHRFREQALLLQFSGG
jgi:hypothetical protein